MTYDSDSKAARTLPEGMGYCPTHPKTGQVVYAIDMDARYCTRCQAGAPADGKQSRPKTKVLRDYRYGTVLTTHEVVADDLGIPVEAVVSVLPGFAEVVA